MISIEPCIRRADMIRCALCGDAPRDTACAAIRPAELLRITELLLERMRRRFAGRGLTLEAGAEAAQWLARQGCDENYGARPLRRLLQRSIEDATAELLLEGKAAPGDRICARVEGDSLHLEVVRGALPAEA